MHGPQAFARTVAPIDFNESIWPSRSIVERICSEPGVTSNGIFALTPLDSDCKLVITADEGIRGGRTVPLKENVDIALSKCPNVHTVLVIQHTSEDVAWNENRDVWYQDAMKNASTDCPATKMDAEDPL